MSVHDRKNLKSALESAILYLRKAGGGGSPAGRMAFTGACLRDQPQHLLCTQ